MTTKRTIIILPLIALSILLVLNFTFFQSKGTTVTISNQTNKVVENLVFSSNYNGEEYSISKIDPNTSISFYKEILILYYYCDFTIKEISKTIGLTEGAAKTLLFRARKKFKTAMEGKNEVQRVIGKI